jgi:hypothetical protein
MTASSLMIHMTAGINNDALLKLGSDLAERLEAKRVIGISACQPLRPASDPMMSIPQDLFDKDRAEMDRQLNEAEQSFRAAIACTGRRACRCAAFSAG